MIVVLASPTRVFLDDRRWETGRQISMFVCHRWEEKGMNDRRWLSRSQLFVMTTARLSLAMSYLLTYPRCPRMIFDARPKKQEDARMTAATSLKHYQK